MAQTESKNTPEKNYNCDGGCDGARKYRAVREQKHVLNRSSPCGGETGFTWNHVSRRALSERTNTSCVVLLGVPSGSGLFGFMGDEAVVSLPSASDHSSSPPTPSEWRTDILLRRRSSRRRELDCVLFCRALDLSVRFDLGFLPLLRAGPCERWALPRCFGRVLNK
jgi:hypothetical protein